MPTRQPLTEQELLQIRTQWGSDRVVNTLLWEIARLRGAVRTFYARVLTVEGYIPQEVIVPDDDEVEHLVESEPAINDEIARKHAKTKRDAMNARELKRVARQTRN